MQEKSTNWKVVSVATVLIGVAIGAYCGFMGHVFHQNSGSTKMRLELNGAPVQQTSDWSID